MSGASSLLLSLSVLPLDLFNLFSSVCNSGRRDNTFRLLDLEVDEFVIALRRRLRENSLGFDRRRETPRCSRDVP
jgi:hypothetical protein